MGQFEPKLRIETTELNDRAVDEALSRQASFGMAPAPERDPEPKTSLLYRPWFALMLAGALGGLAGWAVMEPFVDDDDVFSGRMEVVVPAPGGEAPFSVRVAGIPVVLDPIITRRCGDGLCETRIRTAFMLDDRVASFDEVVAAQHAAVRGTIDDGTFYAMRVDLLPGSPPTRVLTTQQVELRNFLSSLLLFPIVAAMIAIFLASADGILSRAPRRAAICALTGLASGLGVGLAASIVAALIFGAGYSLYHSMTVEHGQTLAAFLVLVTARGLAWASVGTAMGLGQGFALRSRKLLLNGLLGGIVGALLGGLLFDPIDLLLGGLDDSSGMASRAVGLAMIGLTTGLLLGAVELIAREGWLKMLTGPLAGKEFVVYKNPTLIGSSPKADVYLFKDPAVEPIHAAIHVVGEGYEIENRTASGDVFLNGRAIRRSRLSDGDRLRIGKTVLSLGIKER